MNGHTSQELRRTRFDICAYNTGFQKQIYLPEALTHQQGLVITCPSWIDINPIRKEQDDRDCNSNKEEPHLR